MDQIDSIRSMPDIAIFWALASMGLPFLFAVVNRAAWPSLLKWAVSAAGCLVASAAYFLISEEGFDGWTYRNWLTLGLWTIFGATVFYKLFRPAVKEVEVKTG